MQSTPDQDAFVEGVLGLPLANYAGAGGADAPAGGGQDPAAVQLASAPAGDKADGAPVLDKPIIAVKNNGDGSFVITGHGFVHGADVVARVVGINKNGAAEEYGGYTSSGSGGVQITTPVLVDFAVILFFTVSDKRPDPTDKITGLLWSNSVQIVFNPGETPPEDPDPKEDPEPAEPGPSAGAPADGAPADGAPADGAPAEGAPADASRDSDGAASG